MRASHYLAELAAQNIGVFVEGGKVKVNAEEWLLTNSLLSELKTRKSELLDHLTKTEDVRERLNQFTARGVVFYPGVFDVEVENSELLTETEKRFLATNKDEALYLIQRASIMRFCDESEKSEFLFEIRERESLGGGTLAIWQTTQNYFAKIWGEI